MRAEVPPMYRQPLRRRPPLRSRAHTWMKSNAASREMNRRFRFYAKRRHLEKKRPNYDQNLWPSFDFRHRTKRAVVHRSSYELKHQYSDMTPIGLVAKMLTRNLMAAKNKTVIQP